MFFYSRNEDSQLVTTIQSCFIFQIDAFQCKANLEFAYYNHLQESNGTYGIQDVIGEGINQMRYKLEVAWSKSLQESINQMDAYHT